MTASSLRRYLALEEFIVLIHSGTQDVYAESDPFECRWSNIDEPLVPKLGLLENFVYLLDM